MRCASFCSFVMALSALHHGRHGSQARVTISCILLVSTFAGKLDRTSTASSGITPRKHTLLLHCQRHLQQDGDGQAYAQWFT